MKHRIDKSLLTLEENNPSNVLSKGYAILEDKEGKVISSVNNINSGTYKLHLKDGAVEITISTVKKAGD